MVVWVEVGQRTQLQQRNSQRLQTFNQVPIRRLYARDKRSARGHGGGEEGGGGRGGGDEGEGARRNEEEEEKVEGG